MRHFTIAGNWKMHTLPHEADALATAVVSHPITSQAILRGHTIILAPPLTSIQAVRGCCEESGVLVAAQDCHQANAGAFTGDVSAAMVKAAGATCVIVGHSERRRYHGETDIVIGQKAAAVVQAGMIPIICIGEVLEAREQGTTNTVLEQQLAGIVAGLGSCPVERAYVAYEPVWAIGTGVAATPHQAQETHAFIRSILDTPQGALRNVPVLYGGSVTDANALELFACEHIDGALVGGASLKSDQFVGIIAAAVDVHDRGV
jgi:triosephosphate isomerase